MSLQSFGLGVPIFPLSFWWKSCFRRKVIIFGNDSIHFGKIFLNDSTTISLNRKKFRNFFILRKKKKRSNFISEISYKLNVKKSKDFSKMKVDQTKVTELFSWDDFHNLSQLHDCIESILQNSKTNKLSLMWAEILYHHASDIFNHDFPFLRALSRWAFLFCSNIWSGIFLLSKRLFEKLDEIWSSKKHSSISNSFGFSKLNHLKFYYLSNTSIAVSLTSLNIHYQEIILI